MDNGREMGLAQRPHSAARTVELRRIAQDGCQDSGHGVRFSKRGRKIQKAWKREYGLPGRQWVAATELATVVGGAIVKSRKSRAEFGRGSR